MLLKFSKWTGLGNDFVLVEPGESFDMTPGASLEQRVIELCDRRFGIGADGVVVVTPLNENVKGNEFEMRIFNADGFEFTGAGIYGVVARNEPDLLAHRHDFFGSLVEQVTNLYVAVAQFLGLAEERQVFGECF